MYPGFTYNVQKALIKLHFYNRPTIKLNADTLTEINRKFPQLLQPAFEVQGE